MSDLALQALSAAACVSGVFTVAFSLFAIYAAKRFWAPAAGPAVGGLPYVTVLKPVKGVDMELYANLESFLRQDYPCFQVVFCLQDPRDPALPILRRLKAQFPRADIEIIVSPRRIGSNPKVNNLSNAAALIKHELVLISDSDIRVPPDFLREAVRSFADPKVGLATAFYQSRGAKGLGPALESLAVNAWFMPQALGAACLGMRFAMGAAMLVRRRVFDEIGGFEALSRHVADDYVLGASVQALGYRIEILRPVVVSIPDIWSVKEHFEHLLRLCRTIHVCKPSGYLGSGLLHGFSFLLLYAALRPSKTAWAAFGLVAAARMLSVAWIHLFCVGNREIFRTILLLPVSELLQFAAWLGGLFFGKVVWRGEPFELRADGELVSSKSGI
ncbi:MAG: bacteriohopanetetrol glucosamine biosynthesis glycosyltransferase HpnI [Elusimicrobia bacterium]|nr:bacteriohopanetetrol glucosamine biosynthesis glycosyltransferase HpnI [Elusimicrobiota bacterium]